MGGDCWPSGDSKVRWSITWPTRNQRHFHHNVGLSRDANDYVSKIGSKIVLIDGSRLSELMIEFGVAVATDATYTVKRIDNDFFESI
jgi:restriction endonuclease Mrr